MSSFNNRTGLKNINNQGFEMTIVAYRGALDIDVSFEEKYISKHKRFSDFKKGNIAHPKYGCVPKDKDANYKKDTIGLENYNTQGLKMKIVAYRTASDIDVKFEDGYILKHKTLGNFKKGRIKHPNYKIKISEKYIHTERIGEINYAKKGFKMEIVAYRSVNDVDIKINDDFIVCHKGYDNFKRGTIKITDSNYEARVGEEIISMYGLKMKIINYRNYNDIDVEFEDGFIVYHARYDKFKLGVILHPIFTQKTRFYGTYFGYNIELAFENKTKFYNTYKNNNFLAIMTLQEIYQMAVR